VGHLFPLVVLSVPREESGGILLLHAKARATVIPTEPSAPGETKRRPVSVKETEDSKNRCY